MCCTARTHEKTHTRGPYAFLEESHLFGVRPFQPKVLIKTTNTTYRWPSIKRTGLELRWQRSLRLHWSELRGTPGCPQLGNMLKGQTCCKLCNSHWIFLDKPQKSMLEKQLLLQVVKQGNELNPHLLTLGSQRQFLLLLYCPWKFVTLYFCSYILETAASSHAWEYLIVHCTQ